MGKYLTFLVGLLAIACGYWGLMVTWPLFLKVLQIVLPLLLLFGGFLAVLVGLGEIRDSLSARRRRASSSPPTPPRPS